LKIKYISNYYQNISPTFIISLFTSVSEITGLILGYNPASWSIDSMVMWELMSAFDVNADVKYIEIKRKERDVKPKMSKRGDSSFWFFKFT
jgi:hypothetical protein